MENQSRAESAIHVSSAPELMADAKPSKKRNRHETRTGEHHRAHALDQLGQRQGSDHRLESVRKARGGKEHAGAHYDRQADHGSAFAEGNDFDTSLRNLPNSVP